MHIRFKESETKQARNVFPGDLNDHGTLFGGKAMQWMDEVAYITATRFTRMKMVTVKVENINFLKPIHSGLIVEIIGRVIKCSRARLFIEVKILTEEKYIRKKEMATEARFVFAAINKENRPVRIETELESNPFTQKADAWND